MLTAFGKGEASKGGCFLALDAAAIVDEAAAGAGSAGVESEAATKLIALTHLLNSSGDDVCTKYSPRFAVVTRKTCDFFL